MNKRIGLRFYSNEPQKRAVDELHKTAVSVMAFYRLLKDNPFPQQLWLPTRTMFFSHFSNEKGNPLEFSSRKAETWLFQRGFESALSIIHVFLTEFIIQCEIIRLMGPEQKNIASEKDLHNKVLAIKKKIKKLSLPDLLSETKKNLGIEKKLLPFEEEIKSINVVRNELQHRQGKVLDFGISEKSDEIVLWLIKLTIYGTHNGQLVSANFASREQKAILRNLKSKHSRRTIIWKPGEEISIDLDTFNDTLITVYFFVSLVFPAMREVVERNARLKRR